MNPMIPGGSIGDIEGHLEENRKIKDVPNGRKTIEFSMRHMRGEKHELKTPGGVDIVEVKRCKRSFVDDRSHRCHR